jgi:hypothetical protein
LPSARGGSSSGPAREGGDSRVNADVTMEYEEFPAPSSPSLPWFVEYWSASFFRTPALVMDKLCACSSSPYGADGGEVGPEGNGATSSLSSMRENDPFRFDISDRSSSVRQWRLRQVVASYDESLCYDEDGGLFYKDFSSNTRNKLSAPTMVGGDDIPNNSSRSNSNYPKQRTQKNSSRRSHRSIRKSSIVVDDDDDEGEGSCNDDVMAMTVRREGPSDSLQPSCSSLDLYSSRMLQTCDSFGYLSSSYDNYNNDDDDDDSPPALQSRPTTPDARTAAASVVSTASTRRHQPVGPGTALTAAPSSPGNETVTTVSLTQSYMREFENDSDSDSDDDEDGDDSRYLHGRWNVGAAQALQHHHRSPFRRRPVSMMDEVDEEEGHDDDGRDDVDDDASTGNNSGAHVPTRAYKYLIRMRPHNYMHPCKSVDFSGYSVGGVEESKSEDDSDDDDDADGSMGSGDAVLLSATRTLHPSAAAAPDLPFRIGNGKLLGVAGPTPMLPLGMPEF